MLASFEACRKRFADYYCVLGALRVAQWLKKTAQSNRMICNWIIYIWIICDWMICEWTICTAVDDLFSSLTWTKYGTIAICIRDKFVELFVGRGELVRLPMSDPYLCPCSPCLPPVLRPLRLLRLSYGPVAL